MPEKEQQDRSAQPASAGVSSLSAGSRHATPVTVTFEVASDDVWISRDGIVWRVASVQGDIAYLERVVTEQRHVRDLVRTFRKMGDKWPEAS